MTPEQALARLLGGTGLIYSFPSTTTIAVQPAGARAARPA